MSPFRLPRPTAPSPALASPTVAAPRRARVATATIAVLLAGLSSAALAAGAHRHGVADLDLAIDATTLTVTLDVPLDDLVGFERAPRTDSERARVAQALARLRDTASVVAPDPAAGCTAQAGEIVAPVLGVGAGSTPTPADGHAELQATWTFTCRAGDRATWVDLRLFEAFPRLQRIEVQAVTPRGQLKATLRRPAGRIALTR